MRRADCFFHREVPVTVFEITDVPRLPPGFYYCAGVDFEELEPGELSLFDAPLRGPFASADDAKEWALIEIYEVEKKLDAEEANWSFVEEE